MAEDTTLRGAEVAITGRVLSMSRAEAIDRLQEAGGTYARAGILHVHKNLSEIAQWLPGGERIIGRLETYASTLHTRLSDGGLAEPSGQRLTDSYAACEARRVAIFFPPCGKPLLAPNSLLICCQMWT